MEIDNYFLHLCKCCNGRGVDYVNKQHTKKFKELEEQEKDVEFYSNNMKYVSMLISFSSASFDDANTAIKAGFDIQYVSLGVLYRKDFSLYKKLYEKYNSPRVHADLVELVEDVYTLYNWALSPEIEFIEESSFQDENLLVEQNLFVEQSEHNAVFEFIKDRLEKHTKCVE